MQTLILIIIIFLLVGSWIVFIRLYTKIQQRESVAIKKFEDVRRQLQKQLADLDSVIGLFTRVYEIGFQSYGKESKSALSQTILDFACQITKCQVGSLMLIDRETNELYIAMVRGILEQSARLKIGEGVAGRVAESGKTIIISNIDSDIRFIKRQDTEYRSKSMVSIPIQVKNKIVGVLNLHAEEVNHTFEERDIRLLTILSSQGAFAMENVELFDNLQKFYLEMIETLSRTLDLKEHLPESQSIHERMRIYARRIAEELNLPESITKHIEYASLIYGIGKIVIDDSILRKPGKLTPEEYEIIKKHPEFGQKLIAPVKFLSPVTSMILYHQERWDGKGYPSGLIGEEIPLGARIIAIINTYRAMTSDRPYRKALPVSEAIEEIKKGSGTQFDPKIVTAFVKVLEKENSGGLQKDELST